MWRSCLGTLRVGCPTVGSDPRTSPSTPGRPGPTEPRAPGVDDGVPSGLGDRPGHPAHGAAPPDRERGAAAGGGAGGPVVVGAAAGRGGGGVSSVVERSPGWAPWEQHPDPRRSVSTVLCRGGLAATSSAGLGAALTRAVLEANTYSQAGVSPGSVPFEQEKCPGAAGTAPGVASTCRGGS